jgi:myo-inositol-1(or 4)-monophosphatase
MYNVQIKGKIIEQVKDVAKEAGAFIRLQRQDFSPDKVETKGTHDYVSYVDKEAERLIVERLRKVLPEAGFLTEECTTVDDVQHEYVWVIDPLDGTTNFVHGLPPYCVAIALRKGREILLGVVYEVVNDELFWAYQGGGAYLGEQPIRVSNEQHLNDALLCFGFPYNVEAWSPVMQRIVRDFYGHCASIRNLGSAETELCYVACGRFDGYVESYLKPWDVAAGSIILQEAGGMVTDYQGGNQWMDGQQVLATNSVLHEELRQKLTLTF